MADTASTAVLDLVRKAAAEPDADFLPELMAVMSQALMEAEVEAHPGAGRYERTAEPTGQRNDYRERLGAAVAERAQHLPLEGRGRAGGDVIC